MSPTPTDPTSFLPLSQPVLHILLAVADRQRHGYAILKEIEGSTDGRVRLSTGTLYAAIRRLLEDGLIEESDDRPEEALDDARRRYYRLTELGEQVVREESRRLDEIMGLARAKNLLPDPPSGSKRA